MPVDVAKAAGAEGATHVEGWPSVHVKLQLALATAARERRVMKDFILESLEGWIVHKIGNE